MYIHLYAWTPKVPQDDQRETKVCPKAFLWDPKGGPRRPKGAPAGPTIWTNSRSTAQAAIILISCRSCWFMPGFVLSCKSWSLVHLVPLEQTPDQHPSQGAIILIPCRSCRFMPGLVLSCKSWSLIQVLSIASLVISCKSYRLMQELYPHHIYNAWCISVYIHIYIYICTYIYVDVDRWFLLSLCLVVHDSWSSQGPSWIMEILSAALWT